MSASDMNADKAHTITRLYKSGDEMEEILHAAQTQGADQRWLAIAKTHMQLGYMAAKRALDNPPGFL